MIDEVLIDLDARPDSICSKIDTPGTIITAGKTLGTKIDMDTDESLEGM